ncbi:MAG: acetyl-CoA carboxylase biotin carboxyl carrier protein subunit [Chloroflexota bacterium]
MASGEWLEIVRRAVEYVRASDATEVEVAAEDFRLHIVRRPGRVAAAAEHRELSAAAAAVPAADGKPLAAPLTGVFYRTSAPGTPPFVEVGDRVEAGAVVALIETMKIFNEVLAEQGGVIAAILAESGQLVHAGDAVMLIVDAASPGGEQAPS